MQIFFSVGEPSGDQHAAVLINELKSRRVDLTCRGFGGPCMQRAGCTLDFQLTNLAVMGIRQVIPHLLQFYRVAQQARRLFKESPPDAVVLVDFPGFNWWIARYAKAAGIPVFYYLPPQLWAWGSWRVSRVRKFVDHVLCALPFEHEWYVSRGISAAYVGHPFFDEIASHPLDQEFLNAWTSWTFRNVGILPGSRDQEVEQNWPVMRAVMKNIHARHPQARFLVACYKEKHRRYLQQQLAGEANFPCVDLMVGKTSEIIECAECCLMVSGSVSLELMARSTPAVVIYRCGLAFSIFARRLVTCPSVTLPNLIAKRKVMPEFIVAGNMAPFIRQVTEILDRWLSQPIELARARLKLAEVRDGVVQTGASARTAAYILEKLDGPAAEQRRVA